MNEDLIPNYRENKAIAAASMLLELSGGKCDKYWLNKLMYYIERESLIQSGQPMFFDKLYSIPLGPVASAVNDGIDSTSYPVNSAWADHLQLKGRTVSLIRDADKAELSDFEENIIKNAFLKFREYDFKKLKKFFHDLPEYIETNSRIALTYEEILNKSGAKDHQVREAIAEIAYLSFLENSLDCAK